MYNVALRWLYECSTYYTTLCTEMSFGKCMLTLDSKAPSFTPLVWYHYVVASLGEVMCGPTRLSIANTALRCLCECSTYYTTLYTEMSFGKCMLTLDSKAPSFTPLVWYHYVVASLGEVMCGPT